VSSVLFFVLVHGTSDVQCNTISFGSQVEKPVLKQQKTSTEASLLGRALLAEQCSQREDMNAEKFYTGGPPPRKLRDQQSPSIDRGIHAGIFPAHTRHDLTVLFARWGK